MSLIRVKLCETDFVGNTAGWQIKVEATKKRIQYQHRFNIFWNATIEVNKIYPLICCLDDGGRERWLSI